jgi:tRNA pseudouridine32 synthase/23S rRNA pseudouridine746 synthase
MVKSRNSQWKLLSSKQNPAISRFFSWGIPEAAGSGLRVFLIKPESGKTHQIRVALKSLGSPILGDPLYSSKNADRGYLHAYGLRFNYKGQAIEVYQSPGQGSLFLQHQEFIASTVEQGFAKSWPNGK